MITVLLLSLKKKYIVIQALACKHHQIENTINKLSLANIDYYWGELEALKHKLLDSVSYGLTDGGTYAFKKKCE